MENNLSIIIPAYNEEKCIAKNIQIVINLMQMWEIEVIVVNDGSTDNTAKEVLKMCNKHKGLVKLVSYNHNVGKGHAVYEGIDISKYRQKLILDADLSVTPDSLVLFFLGKPILPKNFIIKGQRKQMVKQPLYRILVGKCWQVFVFLITGMWSDTQCPATFLNVPDDFYNNLKIHGFAFDVELLYKANKKNIKIYKTQVSYYNDNESSVTVKATYEMFKDLFKIRFNQS